MIIQSLIDTDLYKFTMMQVVLHHFPQAEVEYRFKCRTEGVDLRGYVEKVNVELDNLCSLRFTKEELEYLRNLRFIKDDFVEFLRLFQLNREYIKVSANEEMEIVIQGSWLHTIMFEVPVLAIVNQIYFADQHYNPDYAEGERRLFDKIDLVKSHPDNSKFMVSDFGTRRRFSREWQEKVIVSLKDHLADNFAGTSNVYLAKKYGLTPIGTMAHEFLQAAQALGPRLRDSQKFALETWAQEYRGDLGIALSDVVGFDAFLRDFDLYFAKLFDGARQDSGDPFEWGEKLIAHYENMRIDPKTKRMVFSDGLDFPLALRIYDRFHQRCKVAFGIGTNLTNDLGYEPIQIVIKMTRCNGQPVAKISDSPGKLMCKDEGYLAYLKSVFYIK
ncbi:MAG: nicotinate phosphoribosyltransferase [Gammaproteobacteria bacterium]|nr:MAG: nicotinate phosphoribosyltransferase [Gammaproteobacteria bacterium]